MTPEEATVWRLLVEQVPVGFVGIIAFGILGYIAVKALKVLDHTVNGKQNSAEWLPWWRKTHADDEGKD